MKTGNGDKVLDAGVVIAAAILFFRTADVLSVFAPTILNDILGMDVAFIYGVVCALLVEGLALALHFNRRAQFSGTAQAVKWTLLVISGVCQVFDGFVVTDTLSRQTDTMRFIFSWGVPLIPLLIMVMVFGIGRLPEEDGTQPDKVPFQGVVPSIKKVLYGEAKNPTQAARAGDQSPPPGTRVQQK